VAFCSQCGNSLADHAFYCSKCGARQPVAGTPGVYQAPAPGMTARTAAMLCYLPFAGWIAALFVLGSQRFRTDRDARFHAFQGLYLFVGWLLVNWVPWFGFGPFHGPFFPLRIMLKLLVIGTSIFMMVKASREERHSLPLIGELAERSL
jgi:uncharacterized membrane protein